MKHKPWNLSTILTKLIETEVIPQNLVIDSIYTSASRVFLPLTSNYPQIYFEMDDGSCLSLDRNLMAPHDIIRKSPHRPGDKFNWDHIFVPVSIYERFMEREKIRRMNDIESEEW